MSGSATSHPPVDDQTLIDRWQALSARLIEGGDDAIIIAGGPDLAYLTGYEAMPLERITAVVATAGAERPYLLIPALEVARVEARDAVFTIVDWDDKTDPADVIVSLIDSASNIVVSDDLWATHLIELGKRLPSARFVTVAEALTGVRAIKTGQERDALVHVGSLADQVMTKIQEREIKLVGRSEAEVATDIGQHLLAAGHDKVQFVIVASGPNSASPHHHPDDRVIQQNEMVLFDFGGTANGFNSDTTRCVFTGEIPTDVDRAWRTLMAAQQAAVDAATAGAKLCDVDAAARTVLADAGYGENFIHRTGHGIGLEVHEQPYVTETNEAAVEVGHAFSIEPGIYLAGQWGMRLEDIVVIEDDGSARRCNHSDRQLRSVA